MQRIHIVCVLKVFLARYFCVTKKNVMEAAKNSSADVPITLDIQNRVNDGTKS